MFINFGLFYYKWIHEATRFWLISRVTGEFLLKSRVTHNPFTTLYSYSSNGILLSSGVLNVREKTRVSQFNRWWGPGGGGEEGTNRLSDMNYRVIYPLLDFDRDPNPRRGQKAVVTTGVGGGIFE